MYTMLSNAVGGFCKCELGFNWVKDLEESDNSSSESLARAPKH
jgi:hypothetical protein